MGVKKYEDLISFQLADALDAEVTRLVLASSAAKFDFRYRTQILDASSGPASHVCEGFLRNSPREFARFLDYALGSIVETERRLHQGIRRGYLCPGDCTEAFVLAKRCMVATLRLRQSQERLIAEDEQSSKRPRRTRRIYRTRRLKEPNGPGGPNGPNGPGGPNGPSGPNGPGG